MWTGKKQRRHRRVDVDIPSIRDIRQLAELIFGYMAIMYIEYVELARTGHIARNIYIGHVKSDWRNVDYELRSAWELYHITHPSDICFAHHHPRPVSPTSITLKTSPTSPKW